MADEPKPAPPPPSGFGTLDTFDPPAVPEEKSAAPTILIRNPSVMSQWMEADTHARETGRKRDLALVDSEQRAIKTAKDQNTAEAAGHSFTKDLGTAGNHPRVVVQLLLENGTKERFMECDLTVTDTEDGISLSMVMICPSCHARGIPQAQCQMTISDRNKKFHIDESTKGTPWEDPDEPGRFIILAGTPDVEEICTCPRPACGFRFRISPHGPVVGVGKLIVERRG